MLWRGVILAEAGHLDSAAAVPEKAVEYDSTNVEALYRLGMVCEYTLRPDKAERRPRHGARVREPGAAGGDFDNDGDPDVAVVNKSGPFNLRRNETPPEAVRSRNWLWLVLEGRRSNRDGVGARIRLVAGGAVQRREVRAGSSYASTEDIRPLFGLGPVTVADSVETRWPSGERTVLTGLPANRTVRVIEGVGHEPVAYP